MIEVRIVRNDVTFYGIYEEDKKEVNRPYRLVMRRISFVNPATALHPEIKCEGDWVKHRKNAKGFGPLKSVATYEWVSENKVK